MMLDQGAGLVLPCLVYLGRSESSWLNNDHHQNKTEQSRVLKALCSQASLVATKVRVLTMLSM